MKLIAIPLLCTLFLFMSCSKQNSLELEKNQNGTLGELKTEKSSQISNSKTSKYKFSYSGIVHQDSIVISNNSSRLLPLGYFENVILNSFDATFDNTGSPDPDSYWCKWTVAKKSFGTFLFQATFTMLVDGVGNPLVGTHYGEHIEYANYTSNGIYWIAGASSTTVSGVTLNDNVNGVLKEMDGLFEVSQLPISSTLIVSRL